MPELVGALELVLVNPVRHGRVVPEILRSRIVEADQVIEKLHASEAVDRDPVDLDPDEPLIAPEPAAGIRPPPSS